MAEPRVVTVDEQGKVLGTAPRLAAHRDSVRHLAISVMLVGADGRLLLQQRADVKALFAGRWSNTVCTHPLPGEDVATAARRRLREELSMDCDITFTGTFSYEALDPASGLTENELDHVFVGRCDAVPAPDPTEVAQCRWVDRADLAAEMAADPEAFTPWLQPVLVTAGLAEARPSLPPLQRGVPAATPTEEPT